MLLVSEAVLCLPMPPQDRDRQAATALDMTPEVEEAFVGFWEAHATCPLRGRNKVRDVTSGGLCKQN